LDQRGADTHGQDGAEACTEELADPHCNADFPVNHASRREHHKSTNVRGEVEKFGMGGCLQYAEAGQSEEGEHVEGACARTEQAIVKADQWHERDREQEW